MQVKLKKRKVHPPIILELAKRTHKSKNAAKRQKEGGGV